MYICVSIPIYNSHRFVHKYNNNKKCLCLCLLCSVLCVFVCVFYVCVCECMCVGMYACVNVCMYVCVYCADQQYQQEGIIDSRQDMIHSQIKQQ